MIRYPQRRSLSPLSRVNSSTIPYVITSNASAHTERVTQVLLVLPQDNANKLKETFTTGLSALQYAKVYIKLSEIIEGDFFNQYIKTGKEKKERAPGPADIDAGNILMLSEGRPGLDHIFSLCEGLRLEVDKPTYERMGLDGVPIPNGGRKHVKARYGNLALDTRDMAMTNENLSNRAQLEAAIDGTREEGLRESYMGLQKRLEPECNLAVL